MSHGAVLELPHEELIRWRAFVNWRAVQRQHARDVDAMRARR